jgi:lactobin A/cerein 7B family class IIb bacteriocin
MLFPNVTKPPCYGAAYRQRESKKERIVKMSYMDTNLGIQELSLNEIEEVEGGWVLIAVAVVAGLACLAVGWDAAHNRAEAAE